MREYLHLRIKKLMLRSSNLSKPYLELLLYLPRMACLFPIIVNSIKAVDTLNPPQFDHLPKGHVYILI